MVPKQREKGGKQGSFIYNYIFDAFCVLKLLPSLQNFKNTSVGVLFLIKFRFQLFTKTASRIFSRRLWYHSEHMQHCAISKLEFLWAVHGVLHEQNISKVWVLGLHLTARFPSIFGNGTILPNVKHFIKCGC